MFTPKKTDFKNSGHHWCKVKIFFILKIEFEFNKKITFYLSVVFFDNKHFSSSFILAAHTFIKWIVFASVTLLKTVCFKHIWN